MEQESTSPTHGNNSPPPGTSIQGPTKENITPLASVFEHSNKRDFSDVMDTKEKDTTNTPKKQKLDDAGQLVQGASEKGKKKQVKVKGPTFEVQEYDFSQTPEGSTNKYRSKTKIMDK